MSAAVRHRFATVPPGPEKKRNNRSFLLYFMSNCIDTKKRSWKKGFIFIFFFFYLTSGFHPHDLLTNWPEQPHKKKKKKKTQKVITFYHATPLHLSTILIFLCSGTRRGGKVRVYLGSEKWPLILSPSSFPGERKEKPWNVWMNPSTVYKKNKR